MENTLVRTLPICAKSATAAWKQLNGVMIAYKPEAVAVKTFQERIKKKLCNELSQMKQPPMGRYVSIKGPTNEDMTVEVHENYSQHPLAIGPAYQPVDFVLQTVNFLSKDASGVLIMGVNNGTSLSQVIKRSKPTRLYRVRGLLGQGTTNCFVTGKVVVKSSYKHVKRYVIDKVCASMQSTHQKKMFGLLGVDIQSEAAYQLAIQGPIKPVDSKIPMLYSIKCINFNPPEFDLEIVCINEHEDYLKVLVDTLGHKLHTNATCTQIKCLQFGFFHINHALLISQMKIENVIRHIKECRHLVRSNRHFLNRGNPILEDKRDITEKSE